MSGLMLWIQGATFIAIALSHSALVLGFAVFIYGLSGYAYMVINQSLIPFVAGDSEESRSQAISLISVASNLGLLIGGVIVSLFSKTYAMVLFFSFGIGLFWIGLQLISEKSITSMAQATFNKSASVLNQRLYRLTLLVSFLLGLYFAQQRLGYQIFLNQYFQGYQSSLLIALNGMLIIVFLPELSKQLLKYNPLYMLGIGGFFLCAGMYFLKFSHAYWFVLLLCILRTIGEMIAVQITMLYCYQSAPNHSHGNAMGMYKVLYAIGTILGSFFGGSLLTWYGISAIWSLGGVLGLSIPLLCIAYEKVDLTSFKRGYQESIEQ
jgi:predicted MFS family arabinose efflux permease